MRLFNWCVAGIVLCAGIVRATEVESIGEQTPWRAYLVQGMNLVREPGMLRIEDGRKNSAFDPAQFDPARHRFSPLPPAGWQKAEFDDRRWARYHEIDLTDYLGDRGAAVMGKSWPAALCLRTSFGIGDPAAAQDLKVTIRCIGGAAVYVNGREIGREFMPAGPLHPLTPAEDYPTEVYVTEDGKTPLPVVESESKRGTPMDPKQAERYQKRIRTISINVPKVALVKGRNVLAVELHRSAVAGPMAGNRGWSHVGFHGARLTSSAGTGVIAYDEAIKGTHLWTAAAEEQMSNVFPDTALVKRSWFHALVWTRGMPVRGIRMANPFDPPLPIRMLAAKNGTCSGQAVVGDVAGVKDVSAQIGNFKGPAGAVLPARNVQVRFAAQQGSIHYCDALLATPPQDATTVPVWVIAEVPKDQTPGWYTSTLEVQANGKSFAVPVQLLVTGVMLPEPKDYASLIGSTHSPEAVAAQYGAAPWSDEHFAKMTPTLRLMGQLGSDVVHVPVILGAFQPAVRDWLSGGKESERRWPMVRFIRKDGQVVPDFAVLEKYLDAWSMHCGAPEALSLYIWDSGTVTEVADAYENRRVASRVSKPKVELKVQLWDPATQQASEMPAPQLGGPEGEAFWKPVLEGVRALVVRRGWSERIIMISQGGDLRPGSKTAEAVRRWAPYARWNLLSHFSGDPAPQGGKMIATGGLEVGLKEWPWESVGNASPAAALEARLAQPPDFLAIHTARWHHQEFSPPMLFRTLPLLSGGISRLGMDFWTAGKAGGPKNASFFVHVNSLTVPGPDGAVPTVRFQLLREGVQDVELRTRMMQAYAGLPEEQRKPCRALLDEFPLRVAYTSNFLSQHELSLDWSAYVARIHKAAEELMRAKTQGAWDQPPQ